MSTLEDVLGTLRHEFDAGEGSFLIRLRCDLVWDRAAFLRLVDAMHRYVSSMPPKEALDRWIGEGFWYLDTFVREWSQHPSFPRVHPPEYYDSAYERLHDLAYWLFVGESPYQDGSGFEPF